MRRLGLGIIAALLALPGSAGAATYCVNKGSACQINNLTLQDALHAAAGSAANDTIHIGEGTYAGPFGYTPSVADAGTLQVMGAGPDKTILQASAATATVFSVGALNGSEPKATIGFFGVRVPDAGTGISTYGDVQAVEIIAQPGADDVRGVITHGSAYLGGVRIHLPDNGVDSTGVETRTASAALSGVATMDTLTVESPDGIELRNSATVAASTVIASNLAFRACSASADVFSSLLLTTERYGVVADSACAPSAAIVRLRNSAVIGEGVDRAALIASDLLGRTARIELDSSIVRGFPFTYATAEDAAVPASDATVAATYSDVDLAAAQPGSSTTIEDGGHNVLVDPLFVDAPARDFRLRWDSPLVDAGNPVAFPGEATFGLYFTPRILDGNADGTLRRDIGPDEYGGPAPRIAVTPGTALPGQELTFDASATTFHSGPVTFEWSFDDGATGSGAVVKHAFATAGAHTATVTVRDQQGRAAVRTVTVTVTAPQTDAPKVVVEDKPAPPAPPAPPAKDVQPPVLSGVKVRGARLRWTVSEDATVTVRLQRCAKPRGRRCRRWAKPRTVSRLTKAGTGTLQLRRSQLRRGLWRARLSAADAAGNRSPRRTVSFTVTR